jgi:carbonic anhydrase
LSFLRKPTYGKSIGELLKGEAMPLPLLKGIRHFKNHRLKEEKDLFESLSKGQSPDVLFITCSDSRLSPHLFTHSGLGVLFIGRNPGNIVPPYPDTSMPSGEASTIEFALTHLKSKEIIVCGHSHCGAMKGLLTPDLKKELPHTAAWIGYSSVLVEHLEKRHPEITKAPSSKLRYLTQDNVLLQMQHLETHPAVAKRLEEGTLKIHGWYYEIDTGEVYIYNPRKNAFVSFEQTVEEVATEALNYIVEQEALEYLKSISKPTTKDHYLALIQTYNKVRFTGVSPIWDYIEKNVKTKLHHLVGELYITEDGGINPLFDELIKKGPSIRLKNLGFLSKAIHDSPLHTAPLRTTSCMTHSHMYYHPSSSSTPSENEKPPGFIMSKL